MMWKWKQKWMKGMREEMTREVTGSVQSVAEVVDGMEGVACRPVLLP
jgi:hypothetical protein